jgi:hypothetical protein
MEASKPAPAPEKSAGGKDKKGKDKKGEKKEEELSPEDIALKARPQRRLFYSNVTARAHARTRAGAA